MIIRTYVKVINREEAEKAERMGMEVGESETIERIAILASEIEAIKPNTIEANPDGDGVLCTDIHMKSGDAWCVLACYDDIMSAWEASLGAEGVQFHDVEPTIKQWHETGG